MEKFFQGVLQFLDTQFPAPQPYGAFHLFWLAMSIVLAIVLCALWKKGIIKDVRKVILVTSIIVIVLEMYKLINLSFGYKDGITFNFPWYYLPMQFCSTPMFVGLLAGLTKGRAHNHFCAYLATYALFAGLAVMLYPGDVLVTSNTASMGLSTLGICIQTMICHGSMITLAIFLYYTKHVKIAHSTILKALPVFVLAVGFAITLNEIFHSFGIFTNFFFFSAYYDSSLPVYSLVHNALRTWNYPIGFIISIFIYIIGFTLAAYITVLVPLGIRYLRDKDFDAEYAEEDARRAAEEAKKAAEAAATAPEAPEQTTNTTT